MNGPDPALVAYVQRRIERTRHRDAERHTLARREAARIRAHAYADRFHPFTPDPRATPGYEHARHCAYPIGPEPCDRLAAEHAEPTR